ncbi:cytochrome P450 [Streptomyces sp. NPDC056069]|uniref:cytochrome P450 n=1 Tax=Streptomyces sp. NPDC056069 TaxID=3345702 RepID=UPI0035DE171D
MERFLPYPFPRTTAMAVPEALEGIHRNPAVQVTLPSGDTVWLVTGYDAVKRLLSDPRVRKDRKNPEDARLSRDNNMLQDPRASLDPPRHPVIRRIISKAFTPARVKQLREPTENLVKELLDNTEAAGPPADLHQTLTFPLAIRTLSTLLGVPPEDHIKFRTWVDKFFSIIPGNPEEIAIVRGELWAYIENLVDARRKNPRDDLISALIRARDEDDSRLTEYELAWWSQGVLLGGYETTANHLGAGIITLLTNPDQLGLLRADPSMTPQAVEELLRIQIVFSSLVGLRYAKEEIEIDGVVIPKGAGVIPAMESANRDGKIFPDPERFDIRRDGHRHLAFGFGPHHCIGSALARMELQTAIGALLRRFSTLQLAVNPADLRRSEGGFMEGFRQVPVKW